MIDEEKLREKLAELLKKPAYRGLYTFEHEHLMNDIVKAANECEETEEKTAVPDLLVESESEEEEE